MKRTFPDWALYLTGSIAILLLGVYMTSGISAFMDIQLSDETKYLAGGMNFFDRVPKGWGPSYSAWYKVLHLLQPDPIKLHYLNFTVLATGVSILLFILLYRLKVPALLAFFIGCCLLFADINIETWPRISHFATSLMLFALIVSTFLKSNYLKLLLFLMTALAISYARPEMGLAFILLLLITGCFVLYKRFRLSKREYIISLALLPVIAIFFMKLGVPMLQTKGKPDMASGNYPRSVTAYGQHFYLNYTEWNKMDDNILFFWDKVFEEHYEVHPSLLKTLLTNVPITVKHVSVNIWNYSRKSFDYVSGVLLPDKILYMPVWLKLVLTLCCIGGFIWLAGWKVYRKNIADHLRKYRTEYLLTLVLTLPPMISCTLIYPREHYIMLQIPLLFLIVTPLLLIHFKTDFNKFRTMIGIVMMTIVIFVLMPKGPKFDHFAVWQDRTGPVNLSAINTINEMGLDETYTVILNEGNIDTYLHNPNVTSLVGYAQLKGIPFNQAIDTFNVKMIYVTSLLEDDPFYDLDDTWLEFLVDPSTLNFERIDLETPYSYLLVDQALVEAGN